MNNTEIAFPGKVLKAGLSLDSFTPSYGFGMGETYYTVCDSVGVIFTTTQPHKLEKFFVQE